MLKICDKELIEDLSELEHDQWTEWSKAVAPEVSEDRRKRWKKHWKPYDELSEKVKDQDREYAKKTIEILEDHELDVEL